MDTPIIIWDEDGNASTIFLQRGEQTKVVGKHAKQSITNLLSEIAREFGYDDFQELSMQGDHDTYTLSRVEAAESGDFDLEPIVTEAKAMYGEQLSQLQDQELAEALRTELEHNLRADLMASVADAVLESVLLILADHAYQTGVNKIIARGALNEVQRFLDLGYNHFQPLDIDIEFE